MPLTGERAQYDLRRDEKLAMYDYVRTVAQRENPSSSFSERELLLLQDSKGELGVPVFLGQSPRSDRHWEKRMTVIFIAGQSGGAKSKTYLERLAEERDFKRRRQSYRAKNVHITKKSYKEVQVVYLQSRSECCKKGDSKFFTGDHLDLVSCRKFEMWLEIRWRFWGRCGKRNRCKVLTQGESLTSLPHLLFDFVRSVVNAHQRAKSKKRFNWCFPVCILLFRSVLTGSLSRCGSKLACFCCSTDRLSPNHRVRLWWSHTRPRKTIMMIARRTRRKESEAAAEVARSEANIPKSAVEAESAARVAPGKKSTSISTRSTNTRNAIVLKLLMHKAEESFLFAQSCWPPLADTPNPSQLEVCLLYSRFETGGSASHVRSSLAKATNDKFLHDCLWFICVPSFKQVKINCSLWNVCGAPVSQTDSYHWQ